MNALARLIVDPYEQVHYRLVQWGRDKFYAGWAEPSPSAVLGHLMDEGRDVRIRQFGKRTRRLSLLRRAKIGLRQLPCKETRSVRMELVVLDGTTTVCPPDGGVAATILRYEAAVIRSQECRQVGELLVKLQDHDQKLWHVVRATYRDAMSPAEIPRRGAGAASMLSIAPSTYWDRRKKAQAWLGRRLFPDLSEYFLTDAPESV